MQLPNLVLAMGVSVLAGLAALQPAFATLPPHLAGPVTLDPVQGLLHGQLCLSRITPRADLRFILSAALNVMVVTDSSGRSLRYRGEYDGRILGEAREYAVAQPDSTRPLAALCVTYRGAVPPFDSNTATTDWKGRITSIGGVLRASEQSRWYPVLYDSISGQFDRDVTYDLSIRCTGCRGIYVNGSRPVAGDFGRFVSAVPRGVLLLAGQVEFHETPEITFVGGRAGPGAARAFSAAVHELAKYYERLLGVPYRERPVLLTFRSVWNERPDGQPIWQFVTWPTIAMSGGVAFDSVLAEERGSRVVPLSLWTTLSHEMGHYYFGTLLDPVGPLRWFALESMAEFLSLKAVRALRGPIPAAARTLQVVQSMGPTTLTPLDRIREADEVTGTYRYQYAPAFLLALETRQGETKVIAMLRNLLATRPGTRVDFELLAAAAEQSGIPRTALLEGWRVEEIRAAHTAGAAAVLEQAADDPASAADAVDIASALVNLDTTATARLAVMATLRRLVGRDSMQLRAQYQIGRIGALTGRELDAAQASLDLYLRYPAPAGGPGHAPAYWRLGQIEEHRGQIAEAVRAYRAALATDPQYTPALEALTRLESRRRQDGSG